MKCYSDGIVYLDDFRLTDASALLVADHDSEHRKRFEVPPDFVPSLDHSRKVIQGWIYDRKLGTICTSQPKIKQSFAQANTVILLRIRAPAVNIVEGNLPNRNKYHGADFGNSV